MSLLAYLIPALFLLVIAILFAGGILTIGALSQWFDRKRQMFFSLMLWAIALGIAIPAVTRPRILVELDLMNMPLSFGDGGTLAMAGFWVSKILTWLVVLLAAGLLVSRVLQSQPFHAQSGQDKKPVLLFLAIATFLITGAITNSLYGTKPGFEHELIYPFLLFGVALTMPGGGYRHTAVSLRNVLLALCVASLVMAVVSPDRALQTGHKGLIPGFDLRLWGVMNHANALGGVALSYLIVERLAPWNRPMLRWLAWGIAFITLVLTQSKTNWMIGMGLAGILFFLEVTRALGGGSSSPGRQQAVAGVLGLMVVGTATVLAILLAIGPEKLFAQVEHSFEAAGATTLTGRDVLWALALKEWHANPLFGYGPTIWSEDYRRAVGIAYAYHSHNQYLNTLSRAGLFGMAGLVLMLAAYLFYAVRYFTATRGALLALFVMIVIRGFTETPMSIWGVFSQETLINLAVVALIVQLARSAPVTASSLPRGVGAT